ncbi:uncharacterized protein LACBIDRAFT_299930 [Laccaria bicolor S238N-H82]|uniref:Predicted protein n=1 Tax=Laccaria bicolor (strain S238N-H82 / ATCC MYA-4686) TaxID=486041 RepID=B0DFN6_LACBS|nr:uncharacterized protein LACBIDRAFT_299930 [Laccaria bicolor S238N-H82]EDR06377.1 predicted protein [Laccaria bicolor S238N-H82]|eukprot:XP_001882749.1 predicted protein [Laccaria bicolor S238N-H82]
MKGPRLMTFRGRIIWSLMVCGYLALAFVIGAAIPLLASLPLSPLWNIAYLSLQYFGNSPTPSHFCSDLTTTSSLMQWVPMNFILLGKERLVALIRRDWFRWKRGLFGGRWYFKLLNLGMGLGGLVMACLGMLTNFHRQEIDK